LHSYRRSAAAIKVCRIVVHPAIVGLPVTGSTAPVFMSTACSALCAKCVPRLCDSSRRDHRDASWLFSHPNLAGGGVSIPLAFAKPFKNTVSLFPVLARPKQVEPPSTSFEMFRVF
jgi:hypothetical protein